MASILETGDVIYANGAFSLRHEIDRTKSARLGRWSKLVPAPMREEVKEIAQPLDRAWTIRTNGIRVPAPRREDCERSEQTLDLAGSTVKSDAYESGPRSQT